MPKQRAKDEDGLTPFDRRFAEEYLIDLNMARAARAAGAPANAANRRGYEAMRKPAVQAYVEKLKAERSERTKIDADDVLKELQKIGFANMGDFLRIDPKTGAPYFDFSAMTRAQAAAIGEVIVEETVDPNDPDKKRVNRKTRFKLLDKRAALVDILRHLQINNARPAGEKRDEDLAGLTDEQIDARIEQLSIEIGARKPSARARAH